MNKQEQMSVYSVAGDKSVLLLVDGLDVINGSYRLVSRGDHAGLWTPHLHYAVKFECKVQVIRRNRLIDYHATLERAERIINDIVC